jgi:hypothetical protein
MPDTCDIPEAIRAIADLQAICLDHETFRSDAELLLRVIFGYDTARHSIAPNSSDRKSKEKLWRGELVSARPDRLFQNPRFSVRIALDVEDHVVTFTANWGYGLEIDGQRVWYSYKLRRLRESTFPIRDGKVTRVLTLTGPFFGSNYSRETFRGNGNLIKVGVDDRIILEFKLE